MNWSNLAASRRVSWVLRLILGVAFIWASWHKILAPDQFALILYGYGIFPGAFINLLAIFVPFVELLSGLCLISGVFKRPALILINAMLICFIIIVSFNLIRGHEFDCGCFSFGDTRGAASAAGLLVRDVFFLACGVCLWRLFVKQNAHHR
ncbi:MAG: protein MauE [Desulfobacterales bacterium]|nr:MAG: protein MauE [Desulfobacterales bacterium]